MQLTNSLPRFNNFIRRLGYPGKFGSPYPQSVVSQEKKAEELSVAGLSIMSKGKLSGNKNLWCREFEDSLLDDPEGFSIPENAYDWTRRYKEHATQELALGFENGNLISVDGKKLTLIRAIALLDNEHRSEGSAAIIMEALRSLEIATLESKTLKLKQQLEQKWTREAIAGHWGSACHNMCDVAIAASLNGVGGTVTYVIDSMRFLPYAIKAQNPSYVRDQDQWERAQQGLGEVRSMM
ncbi:uncharacterized protein EAE97_000270 [Botrytis byssoidea]|uniref:argininosuccinate synthase n=1 Tax=Botrytis byssoidea TaxID=139641 RepID=A0A9P5IYV6_9HELO|nr:uncharacterized protein EAE97_000270 [Botrytis byssoidea]KAF7955011.1 hypothetical protein EAE97_000270 [Botrytis byssoidea]